MKSMLHEASSIIKAIEKAWIESGKPAEFTIKILEKGEKNFLGMAKRPAIVSITYGASFFDKSRNKNFSQPSKPFTKVQGPKLNFDKEPGMERQIQRGVAKGEQKRYETFPKVSDLQSPKESLLSREKEAEKEIQIWNDEMAVFCSNNLKEILQLLKIESDFGYKINSKNLLITFDKKIVSAVPEDQKSFFASLAHILMQLLKRKHKKRFKGIQIILNHTASNDASSTNKSN